MIITKSNGSGNGGPAFTFELNATDLAQLALNIQEGDWRASIRQDETRAFLGSLEFRTMQFRPFAGRKEMLGALKIGESLSAFIVPGEAATSVDS